jgi:hypothetical protein
MAHVVELSKSEEINGKQYERGDILSVGASLYAKLKASGTAKDHKPKPKTKTKKAN